MDRAAFSWGLLSGVWVTCVVFGSASVYHRLDENLRETLCTSGLVEARPLFEVYKEQHAGNFPPRLDDLDLENAGGDALRCPKAPKLGVHAYLYIPPRHDSPDDTPILVCWRHRDLLVLTKGGGFRRLPP